MSEAGPIYDFPIVSEDEVTQDLFPEAQPGERVLRDDRAYQPRDRDEPDDFDHDDVEVATVHVDRLRVRREGLAYSLAEVTVVFDNGEWVTGKGRLPEPFVEGPVACLRVIATSDGFTRYADRNLCVRSRNPKRWSIQ